VDIILYALLRRRLTDGDWSSPLTSVYAMFTIDKDGS
jgi:hypothetical protein